MGTPPVRVARNKKTHPRPLPLGRGGPAGGGDKSLKFKNNNEQKYYWIRFLLIIAYCFPKKISQQLFSRMTMKKTYIIPAVQELHLSASASILAVSKMYEEADEFSVVPGVDDYSGDYR